MHYSTIMTLALGLGTQVSAQLSNCNIATGGPTLDQKTAVMNLVWESSFSDNGENCPSGFGFYDDAFTTECYVCDGAFISIANSAADFADVCFTWEEFDETLRGEDGQECKIPVDMHESLMILYGHDTDFTISDPDSCWYC